MEYAALRKKMIEEQLRCRGIKNEKVLEVFMKVKRDKFIPEDLRASSYADYPIPIGEGQTISQPYMVALMTECLNLTGKERILEIGTGSGYQTAILAELAKEVYSMERHEKLAKQADMALKEAGYANIKIKVGDGTLGWPEEAPFDRIIITAAADRIPLPLTEQLKEEGSLVMPLGESFNQVLSVTEKKNNKLETIQMCGCVFVPLIGKFGCKE